MDGPLAGDKIACPTHVGLSETLASALAPFPIWPCRSPADSCFPGRSPITVDIGAPECSRVYRSLCGRWGRSDSLTDKSGGLSVRYERWPGGSPDFLREQVPQSFRLKQGGGKVSQ